MYLLKSSGDNTPPYNTPRFTDKDSPRELLTEIEAHL